MRSESEPSRRRGPHQPASPGHVPRLRGTRTELRSGRCVRRPGAAPSHGPAGEKDPTPGIPGWTAPGTLRSAHARSATGAGSGRRHRVWGPCGSCAFSAVLGALSAHSRGERARRAERRSATVRSLARPFPLAVCCLSDPSSLLPFFLSSCPPLISLLHLRQKGAP